MIIHEHDELRMPVCCVTIAWQDSTLIPQILYLALLYILGQR